MLVVVSIAGDIEKSGPCSLRNPSLSGYCTLNISQTFKVFNYNYDMY